MRGLYSGGLVYRGKFAFENRLGLYSEREIYVLKLIGLAYSWKEIYVSNFQKGFTETRLEDKDLTKTQPWKKYFVYIERGNSKPVKSELYK